MASTASSGTTGEYDWDGGNYANLDTYNTWQQFFLDSTARLDLTVATRARGDVGMAKQYKLAPGESYAFSAYARVKLVNVQRRNVDDFRGRISIHKVGADGKVIAECNATTTVKEEWKHLKIYNCGLSGGVDGVRANVRLNAAALDPVRGDERPAGTGEVRVDWFKLVRECVPVGSCPLTNSGTLNLGVL